jgi:hypothetical protein
MKSITLSLAAIYLIGAILTGFTYVMRNNMTDMGSETLVSSTMKYGVYWPIQLHRVLSRII